MKLGNPGPWAVLAFSTTSFLLGCVNAGLIDGKGMPTILDVALIFGGIIQIIVAVLEFTNGSTFTCAVFGTFGSFWIMFAALFLWFGGPNPALQMFLIAFAVLTFIFWVASWKTDMVLIIVFFLVFIVLLLLAFGMGTLAGWLTIIFAILGWYHAAAGIIASTWGKEVLPVFPIKK